MTATPKELEAVVYAVTMLANQLRKQTGKKYASIKLSVASFGSEKPTVYWLGFVDGYDNYESTDPQELLEHFENYDKVKANRIAELRKELAELEGAKV